MGFTSEKKYPVNPNDYKLYEEIGDGVSATVYSALCIPFNETVAIKILDLEKCNNDLDGIRREVQTMILIDHTNLLRAHCSFSAGHHLWIVMPYMAGGSCLHIMKSAYQEGFEEAIIATLLRETLKALVYLHAHGHIHRDVKAGNILIDSKGAVKLADFGVSACMFDTGDRQRVRNTFVGTPCWMAPEVMQQLNGYDFKADIWSFGITALELAHGHAPFSKYPPMKVLLMTLQNAPPGLDYERDKRFSKSFKDLVATCLVKDPKKRPTSEKLLKHSFFKHARNNEYLARGVLNGLPPLGDRYRMLKAKEADLLIQGKAVYEDKEHLSQQEYIRGISAWNFNIEDLKSQAALIEDYDCVTHSEDLDNSRNQWNRHEGPVAELSSDRSKQSNSVQSYQENGLNDFDDLEGSLASFPIKPLQALKGCFDVGEDDDNAVTPRWKGPSQNHPEEQVSNAQKKFLSGSLIPDDAFSPKKMAANGDKDIQLPKYQAERSLSGPLSYRQRRDANSFSVDDAAQGAVVQRKGRFKVTSAELSPKASVNSILGPVGGVASSSSHPNSSSSSILPLLHGILQQNAMQREEILRMIKYMEQASGKTGELVESGTDDLVQATPSIVRETELQAQAFQLQQSIGKLVEELRRQKLRNAQLEKQLNGLTSKEERQENGG